MPRFVLLEHDHPMLHWDFMLEWGSVIRTWRLDRIPAETATLAATTLPDHRLAYLDYEGPVSGDRGSVKRVDSGSFELLAETSEGITVRLDGEVLTGRASLTIGDSAMLNWHPDVHGGGLRTD